MENFIGLIVVIVIWSIIGFFRKSAKMQQAAQQKLLQQKASQNRSNTEQSATPDEISRLFEMLAGAQPSTNTTYTQVSQNSNNDSIESLTEEGGREEQAPLWAGSDVYTPQGSSIESYMSESDFRPMFSSSDEHSPISHPVAKNIHPLLEGFDPRKAVIYSEILQPRYF